MVGEKLQLLLKAKKIKAGTLASLTGIPKSTIYSIIRRNNKDVNFSAMEKIADALGVPVEYFYDQQINIDDFENLSIPAFKTVPLIGTIACGEPILAVENYEGYVSMPEHIHADMALRCKGDSMIEARINDGDIVYIRQQPDIENGQIAAVLINDEVTLKRVYRTGEQLILQAANAKYQPIVLTALSGTVRILGIAVGFYSDIK